MCLSVLRGPIAITGSVGLRTVDVTTTNIYGRITPPGPGQPNVLLTAHYDGVGDDPQQRLPAAADNASGVAVILEVARHIARHPLPIGVTVAFLDAEEAGAHGSAHHAPQLPPGTLVINLDGAAALQQAAAVVAGGPAHTLLDALDRVARVAGLPLRAQAMPSDNHRYAAAGHAAIGIGMGLPGYQTPAETPDRVELQSLHRAAHLLVATIAELADAT
jgi:Zn-dependent M28 family amino/carboxypeptidase